MCFCSKWVARGTSEASLSGRLDFTICPLTTGGFAFDITFDWDEINGVPGAFIIRMAILKLLQSDQNNGKP